MDDIEIAIAVLEMVVIMYPLTVAAFGLSFRARQSSEESEIFGLGNGILFGVVPLFSLILLAISGLLLGIYISIRVRSTLVRLGISVLLGVFGAFAGFSTLALRDFVNNLDL